MITRSTPIIPPANWRWRAYVEQHRGFYNEVKLANTRRDLLLLRLKSASSREQRDLCRVFLRDRRSRLAFAWRAVVRRKRYGLSPAAIQSLVSKSNPFCLVHEHVRQEVERPWGRKPRQVVKVGIRRQIQQSLVAALIRTLHSPSERQYFSRGVPAALKAVEEIIRAGFTYGAEIDVVSFYPNIPCSDELTRLLRPLPETVVETVVFDRAMNLVGDPVLSICKPNSGRRRLPVGSACSPAVGEIIMKTILGCLPEEWPIVNYHDNVFVFGHSQQEINARIETIREIARSSALGDLEFGQQPKYWVFPEELTFLGQTATLSQRGLRWRPADAVLSRYLWACEDASFGADKLREIIGGLDGFRRTYREWDEGDTWLLLRRAELMARLFYETGELLDGNSAIEALIEVFTNQPLLTDVDVIPAAYKKEHERHRAWLVNQLDEVFWGP